MKSGESTPAPGDAQAQSGGGDHHEGQTRASPRGAQSWALALAAVAAGTSASVMEIGDRQWLARPGALVVMLGIWSGVGGIISERALLRGAEFRRRIAKRRLKSRYDRQPQVLEEKLAELEANFDQLAERHRAELKLKIGIQEAALLLTGTFIWGFGDLIKYFVLRMQP